MKIAERPGGGVHRSVYKTFCNKFCQRIEAKFQILLRELVPAIQCGREGHTVILDSLCSPPDQPLKSVLLQRSQRFDFLPLLAKLMETGYRYGAGDRNCLRIWQSATEKLKNTGYSAKVLPVLWESGLNKVLGRPYVISACSTVSSYF